EGPDRHRFNPPLLSCSTAPAHGLDEIQIAELDAPAFAFQAKVAPRHFAVCQLADHRAVDPHPQPRPTAGEFNEMDSIKAWGEGDVGLLPTGARERLPRTYRSSVISPSAHGREGETPLASGAAPMLQRLRAGNRLRLLRSGPAGRQRW